VAGGPLLPRRRGLASKPSGAAWSPDMPTAATPASGQREHSGAATRLALSRRAIIVQNTGSTRSTLLRPSRPSPQIPATIPLGSWATRCPVGRRWNAIPSTQQERMTMATPKRKTDEMTAPVVAPDEAFGNQIIASRDAAVVTQQTLQ